MSLPYANTTARNMAAWTEIARNVFLPRLDAPRAKTDPPIRPVIAELFGLFKSGKDTQLNELERWFGGLGFKIFIHPESAEIAVVRALTRNDPYAFEMRHFAYNLGNIIDATQNRVFHVIFLNRGIFDTLCWIESLFRRGKITTEQYKAVRTFIFSGENSWLPAYDALIYLTCDVNVALEREYGNAPDVVYGSRMNPKTLTLFRACCEFVFEDLRTRYPNLPIFKIDTSHLSIPETRDKILALLLHSVEQRLELREEEILPWSPTLMRQKAQVTGRELKLRGSLGTLTLQNMGWSAEGSIQQIDVYLTPHGIATLDRDECYHIRSDGNGHFFFVYKRRSGNDPRARIVIPIPKTSLDEFQSSFEVVATITKVREIFIKDGFVLAVDEVEQLGNFLEIKAPRHDMAEINMMKVVHELGFSSEDIVPDSYLRLYLKSKT